MGNDKKTRRDMFRMAGGLGAAALLLYGCGDDASADGGGAGTAGTGGTGGTGGSSGMGGSSGTGGSSAGTGGTAAGTGGTAGAGGSGSEVAWATAGTSVMVGKDYGNPFASGIGATCPVYKSSTGGPCHATSEILTRKDVSEGYAGLPMRLELLVVDANCKPVPGATVEIWHCDTLGVYSGDVDGNNDDFCTGGDAEAAAALWYRGIQTAGDDGRVTFDTNFPGWYSGRATHIHFKVTVNGTEYLTSQLFVDEDLKTEIYSSQPNYKQPSGQGYRLNASDQVISEAGLTLADVTLATARQSDGAMLAWKAITVSA